MLYTGKLIITSFHGVFIPLFHDCECGAQSQIYVLT